MLTPAEIQILDMVLATADAVGLPPAAKSCLLLKTGQGFNPRKASKSDINSYINNVNPGRPLHEQLPYV